MGIVFTTDRWDNFENLRYFGFSMRFSHLVEELFPSCVWLDGELQLRIYRCHPHVHWLRHVKALILASPIINLEYEDIAEFWTRMSVRRHPTRPAGRKNVQGSDVTT